MNEWPHNVIILSSKLMKLIMDNVTSVRNTSIPENTEYSTVNFQIFTWLVYKYRVRQRGCSLTHSCCPARNYDLGWQNWIWEKIMFWNNNNFFLGGGPLPHFFFFENLLVRVKLGHPPNFNFLGKPLLGEKYVHGKKKKKKKKKEEQ